MQRALVVIAMVFAFASTAWAQMGEPPVAPPANASLVLSPGSDPPAFVETTTLVRDGAKVRVWVLNVFRDPQTLQSGAIADAAWTLYETDCTGAQYARVVSYWVDANGAIAQTFAAGWPRPLAAGSAIYAGKAAMCDNLSLSDRAHLGFAEALAQVRQ